MLKALASALFYGRFAKPFSVIGYRQAARHFDQTPPQFDGQRWLVTGASGGIGRAVALRAIECGATVYALARSSQKLRALQAEASEPSALIPVTCDLSLMQSIADQVQDWKDHLEPPFDVVVNNVGVLLRSLEFTREGLEQSLATNLLGPVCLTEGLVDAGLLSHHGHVINVSSGGMYGTPLCLEPMIRPTAETFDGVSAYAMHKRAQVSWTHDWNRRHPKGPLMSVMHPGWVETEGVRTSLPRFYATLKAILRTPEQGADTVIWLASAQPEAIGSGIWLDRAVAPEHVFSITRRATVTPEDLNAYLDQTLAQWR